MLELGLFTHTVPSKCNIDHYALTTDASLRAGSLHNLAADPSDANRLDPATYNDDGGVGTGSNLLISAAGSTRLRAGIPFSAATTAECAAQKGTKGDLLAAACIKGGYCGLTLPLCLTCFALILSRVNVIF